MIPVKQTKINDEDGDCFNACLASIMELPLERIPEFQKMGSSWFVPFLEFLHEQRYEYLGTKYGEEKIRAYRGGIDGYYIVGGGSPRGFSRGHAVVFKDGEMVHDPHPDSTGLTEIKEAWIIERKKLIPPEGEVRLIYGQPREKGFVGQVILDGQTVYKFACPDCGRIGYLDEHRVLIDGDFVTIQPSVVCECGFHAMIEANKIMRI